MRQGAVGATASCSRGTPAMLMATKLLGPATLTMGVHVSGCPIDGRQRGAAIPGCGGMSGGGARVGPLCDVDPGSTSATVVIGAAPSSHATTPARVARLPMRRAITERYALCLLPLLDTGLCSSAAETRFISGRTGSS